LAGFAGQAAPRPPQQAVLKRLIQEARLKIKFSSNKAVTAPSQYFSDKKIYGTQVIIF